MVEKELKNYTLEQVKENNGMDNKPLWIIINGEVYDVTEFSHPGGKSALTDDHGEDRYDDFESIHSKGAKKDSLKYKIGKLILDEGQKKIVEDRNSSQKHSGLGKWWTPIYVLVISYVLVFKFNLFGLYNTPTSN